MWLFLGNVGYVIVKLLLVVLSSVLVIGLMLFVLVELNVE